MDIAVKNFVKRLSLKQKIAIILGFLVFIRVGSLITLPFVNADYMKELLQGSSLGFFSVLTGSSLSDMGIFALGITPYISASIIIQLLTVVFPSLEKLAKDGQKGREKYKRIIRYTGIGLSLLQAVAMAIGFGRSGLITPYGALTVIGASLCWTIGATILIAIGEFIDLFEIGSGISMILFLNIVSTIPNDVRAVYSMHIAGKNIGSAVVISLLALAVSFAVLFACNFLMSAERRLTLTTSKRMSSYTAGNNTTTMPVPFLTCSVMPVIFTSSLLSVPLIIERFVPALQTGVAGNIIGACSQSRWFDVNAPWLTLGVLLYIALTTFFTYFYLTIQYNPLEIAENLKKTGSAIPGIRPGKPTADYIGKVTRQTALAGNACLVAVIIVTTLITNLSGISNMALGGTSAIIAVSVIHDVRKKIAAELKAGHIRKHSPMGLFGGKERSRA